MLNFLHICAVLILTLPLGSIFLFVCVCSLFVNKKKAYKKESKFYRFLLQGFTSAALWTVGVKIHVTGLEKLPQGESFLLVGNHISNYDPIITWKILKKRKMRFISKGSNFKIPFMGQLIHRCRFMEIDRENPRNPAGTGGTANRRSPMNQCPAQDVCASYRFTRCPRRFFDLSKVTEIEDRMRRRG